MVKPLGTHVRGLPACRGLRRVLERLTADPFREVLGQVGPGGERGTQAPEPLGKRGLWSGRPWRWRGLWSGVKRFRCSDSSLRLFASAPSRGCSDSTQASTAPQGPSGTSSGQCRPQQAPALRPALGAEAEVPDAGRPPRPSWLLLQDNRS